MSSQDLPDSSIQDLEKLQPGQNSNLDSSKRCMKINVLLMGICAGEILWLLACMIINEIDSDNSCQDEGLTYILAASLTLLGSLLMILVYIYWVYRNVPTFRETQVFQWSLLFCIGIPIVASAVGLALVVQSLSGCDLQLGLMLIFVINCSAGILLTGSGIYLFFQWCRSSQEYAIVPVSD